MKNMVLIVFLLLLTGSSAFAHKLKVFAYVENENISGYCYYPGGARAKGVDINFCNEKGDTVLSGKSDEKGEFEFKPAEAGRYKLVAQTPDGHGSSFEVAYSSNDKPSTAVAEEESEDGKKTVTEGTAKKAEVKGNELSEINGRLAAIEEMLVRQEEKLYIRDLLGTVGFIFGIFGVFAYYLARKKLDNGKK